MDVGERMTPHNLFNDQVREEFGLTMHRYRTAVPYCIGKHVLDSGCGVGNGSFLLSAVAETVTAIDSSEEAITFAKRYYLNTNLAFKTQDILKSVEEQFDVIVSLDVIEHIQDPARYLHSLSKQLRPSGVLIISTPNKPVLQLLYPEPNRFHHSEMDEQEFRRILERDFAVERLTGQIVHDGKVTLTDELKHTRTFIAFCRHHIK